MSILQKAIFLDKDGTLMEDIPYNSDPQLFQFADGVPDGLRLLSSLDYSLFVISNQSGVGRGYFAFDKLAPMEQKLHEMFQGLGLALVGVSWCPHYPGGKDPVYGCDCQCRKPYPGMLKETATLHQLHLPDCWMVGDKWSDVEAGQAAGCRTAYLNSGSIPPGAKKPDVQSESFLDLARQIARLS